MSVFDYSYSYFTNYLTPVYRRLSNALALVNVWLSPLEWLRNNTWNYRKNGSNGNEYNNSITYNKGDIVNYGGATYECLSTIIGNNPTNPTYWILVAENMIGWDERVIYQGRKKQLEYALYRFFLNFDLTLNFYNYKVNTNADNTINISTAAQSTSFISFSDNKSSAVFSNSIGDAVYLTYNANTTQFAINVPNSVQIAYGGTTKTTNTINSIVNKYKIVGVNFTINYY